MYLDRWLSRVLANDGWNRRGESCGSAELTELTMIDLGFGGKCVEAWTTRTIASCSMSLA